MHDSVLNFGQRVVEQYALNYGKVLEIGSQNVNGSLRDFFSDTEYTGVDIQAGPGVDLVIETIEDLLTEFECTIDDEYDHEQFDTIIFTEVIEHDKYFWVTLDIIGYLLKKDGYLIMSGRGVDTDTNKAMFEHSYPYDYWRFMPQSIPHLFDIADCDIVENHKDTQHEGFYALGKRR